MTGTLNRRNFLKLSGAAGTSLVLGIDLSPARAGEAEPVIANMVRRAEGDLFVPNAYLSIAADGTCTIQIPRTELGQGVNTSLAMLVAEDLDADWDQVVVEHAPPDSRVYGNQVTGGSRSISQSYRGLRRAGAVARWMLIQAAAQTWGVAAEECTCTRGEVIHAASERRVPYGELVAVAATLEAPPPSEVTLKEPSAFTLIGTRRSVINGPEFVTGKAQYASDVQLPGMLIAVVARSPFLAGEIAGYDAEAARAVPGVVDVLEVNRVGLVVVAEHTWAALKGRAALAVQWTNLRPELSTEAIYTTLRANLPEEPAAEGEIEAEYELPYLAHAPMEPMTAAADVRADGADVWAPTQDRARALQSIQLRERVPVTLRVPLVGGGFGRRLVVDYAPEAARIAEAVGAPVKVFWSREDDIAGDYYRPGSVHRVRATLDAAGLPVSWQHDIAAQPIDSSSDLLEGAIDMVYRIPNKSSRSHAVDRFTRVTYWRAVFNNQSAFANECFLDELAVAGGQDPVALRLALLSSDSREYAVIAAAAEHAGWGDPLPEGWGRGFAFHSTWSASHVAQVMDVEVTPAGAIRVHRVVCVVDCGVAVNPDGVSAQMEGGIVFGLAAALHQAVTFDDGRIEQTNFHDFPHLRLDAMPEIVVHIMPSERDPQGVGEMAVPPSAPALVNAIYAATGKRVRRLPIRVEDVLG